MKKSISKSLKRTQCFAFRNLPFRLLRTEKKVTEPFLEAKYFICRDKIRLDWCRDCPVHASLVQNMYKLLLTSEIEVYAVTIYLKTASLRLFIQPLVFFSCRDCPDKRVFILNLCGPLCISHVIRPSVISSMQPWRPGKSNWNSFW